MPHSQAHLSGRTKSQGPLQIQLWWYCNWTWNCLNLRCYTGYMHIDLIGYMVWYSCIFMYILHVGVLKMPGWVPCCMLAPAGSGGECLRKLPAPNMFKASMFVRGDMFFATLGICWNGFEIAYFYWPTGKDLSDHGRRMEKGNGPFEKVFSACGGHCSEALWQNFWDFMIGDMIGENDR